MVYEATSAQQSPDSSPASVSCQQLPGSQHALLVTCADTISRRKINGVVPQKIVASKKVARSDVFLTQSCCGALEAALWPTWPFIYNDDSGL